jgi:GH15 family glucan-1,4-alpha-glucosidase
MPLQGFISPRDPRWLSTLAAMDRELVSDKPGVPLQPERQDDARLTFEKMQAVRSVRRRR